MAKTHFAPLKQRTIPQLELKGACEGVDLATLIATELHLDKTKTTFHTDSQTVLQWINSQTCKFDVFTGNRIGKILQETDPTQWRHVAGVYNPADACSRGIDPADIDSLVAFHQGPVFLLEDPATWPTWEPTSQEALQESTCCAVMEVDYENNCVDRLVSRISSKMRLERTMAWCLRFVHNCRHRNDRKSGDDARRDGCRPGSIHRTRSRDSVPA